MLEIITGKMVAAEHKKASYRDLIQSTFDDIKRAMAVDIDMHIDEIDTGNFVQAMVDFGRWGARCECGGAEYVDPEDPVFYCFSCGNKSASGKLRPVQFPVDWEDIGHVLSVRPISVHKGITASAKAFNSTPLTDAARHWEPGITLKDLQDENEANALEKDVAKIKLAKGIS